MDIVKKILLVDDHAATRAGLAAKIGNMDGFSVCGEACDFKSTIALLLEHKPDIVILDLMLGERSCFDLAERIRSEVPSVKILAYSLHEDANSVERAFHAGVTGYCSKSESLECVQTAIEATVKGERYLCDRLKEKLLTRLLDNEARGGGDPIARLTSREFAVFSLIGKGYAIDDIASELSLSPKTVNNHRDNIRTKLGLATARELVQYAFRWMTSATKT